MVQVHGKRLAYQKERGRRRAAKHRLAGTKERAEKRLPGMKAMSLYTTSLTRMIPRAWRSRGRHFLWRLATWQKKWKGSPKSEKRRMADDEAEDLEIKPRKTKLGPAGAKRKKANKAKKKWQEKNWKKEKKVDKSQT